MRTLLLREVEKRKIEATAKEIKDTIDQIKENLPPDKKLDVFMKENKISRDDIALGIKVKKMVMQDLGKKAKPSQKEISKFYNDNKDKFVAPENVHVRHILVAFAEGDDDKVKAEKKIKIENLRKQVTDGADFAEVARKSSDCPSKDNGGDLGLIKKGQTVKPFEDAAFSQEIKVIGPIVATEYGYHIIQVLEHNQPKTVALEEAKDRIAPYLEQQKQSAAFDALLNKLRDNAKIIVYDK
jgi:peptidyl-prolyl cis-trans isomerase C